MSKNEYKLDPQNITNKSEQTSAISLFSYEIENANLNNLNKDRIMKQVKILKSQKNSLLILNI